MILLFMLLLVQNRVDGHGAHGREVGPGRLSTVISQYPLALQRPLGAAPLPDAVSYLYPLLELLLRVVVE